MPSTNELTSQQLTTLKNDIVTHPELNGLFAQEIADWYNVTESPDWIVWRTSVQPDEWRKAILETTGAGTQFDGLTASKRECLVWAFTGVVDPSVPATRASLDDWCGTQNTLKAAVQLIQKRKSTRAEKLFSSGTGSDASPATMTFEGTLTYQQVEAAQQS